MKAYNKISPALSWKLDLLRALAASLVMLGHLRGGFFLAFGDLDPNSQNLANKILFFITKIGHECVLVFFVLSGFLVGGSFLSDWIKDKSNFKNYFINRLTRMWLVVIPVLVIGGLTDFCSYQLNPYFAEKLVFDWKTFFGNLFFLQKITVPVYGNNSPLWSLANEFWYYLIWPLLLFLVKLKSYLKYFLIICVIYILSILIPEILKLFPLWVLGAILRIVPDIHFFRTRKWKWLFSISFILSIFYSCVFRDLVGSYLVGFTLSALILSWMYDGSDLKRYYRFAPFMASFSFSLYAFHYPIMFFLYEICKKYLNIGIRLLEATLVNWLILISLASIIYLFSWFFYLLFERNTVKLRNRIYFLLDKKAI